MEASNQVACCGLFCGACSVFIATRDHDEAALAMLAAKMKVTKEDLHCEGCRSDRLSLHCRDCAFLQCAKDRQVANCEACDEFPCATLQEFQKKMPHRIELFESAAYRKEHGIDAWIEKMRNEYACKVCGVVNSPYYLTCKGCGAFPGNDYIARNESAIKAYLGV